MTLASDVNDDDDEIIMLNYVKKTLLYRLFLGMACILQSLILNKENWGGANKQVFIVHESWWQIKEGGSTGWCCMLS